MGYRPVRLSSVGTEPLHVLNTTGAGPGLAVRHRAGHDGGVTSAAPAPTEIAIAADGTELAAYHFPPTGPGVNPVPVLLVHGFGSNAHWNWVRTGWVRDLTAAGREVLAVDLRGHGRSGHPSAPGAYRLRTLVSDLTVVLQAVLPESTTVDAVGYSLGARVVTELANQTSLVRRLVLGGSDGRPLYQDVDAPAVAAALRAGGSAEHRLTQRIVEIARALPTSNVDALAAVTIGLAAEDSQAGSHTPIPSVPVLVAGGDHDEMFTGATLWVQEINNAHPGRAQLLLVEGRGHVNVVPSGVFRQGGVGFLAG